MPTLNAIEDELLVMHCQDGNAEAMNLLVRRWQPRLWRHARLLTGADDAAWDVAQESWLAIVRGLHRLLDASQFRVWAYRIVTNKSTDWIRRQVRGRRVAAEAAMLPRNEERGPEDVANQSERAESLDAALLRLGTEHRVVLTLFYLEEMNIAEIAASLDVPLGTVKSRLFHARKELKDVWLAQEPAANPNGGKTHDSL